MSMFCITKFKFVESKLEHLILRLADHPWRVVAKRDTVRFHGLDHWRWATQKQLDVVCGRRQVLAHQINRDESKTALPSRWGIVQHMHDSQTLWVLVSQLLQFVAQQNVFFTHVAEQKRQLCRVSLIAQNGLNNLVHWRDSGAASDHSDCATHVWFIQELPLWTTDVN